MAGLERGQRHLAGAGTVSLGDVDRLPRSVAGHGRRLLIARRALGAFSAGPDVDADRAQPPQRIETLQGYRPCRPLVVQYLLAVGRLGLPAIKNLPDPVAGNREVDA